MEYISAEKFLKESKEVQDVFLKWWNPSIGDLYTCAVEYNQVCDEINCITSVCVDNLTQNNEGVRIPVFTEGQLRKFIEERASCKLMVEYTSCENIVIRLCREDEVNGRLRCFIKYTFPSHNWDIINAYWRTAIKLIAECS